MKETGFCWDCEHICKGLFCAKPKKCQDKYERKQDSGIKKGKRASYGVSGSMH